MSNDPQYSSNPASLPVWAEQTDTGIRCTVCGNEGSDVGYITHDCIYSNPLVTDGGETISTVDHTDTEWVCMQCFIMNPDVSGHVTVHGSGHQGDGSTLTVWCPWCGDKMDLTEELLSAEEFKGILSHTRSEDVQ